MYVHSGGGQLAGIQTRAHNFDHSEVTVMDKLEALASITRVGISSIARVPRFTFHSLATMWLEYLAK